MLLHGPVGSSKSTIVRLLKKGLEHYSRTDEGALYTFALARRELDADEPTYPRCPMHEEPLHLIPRELRERILDAAQRQPVASATRSCVEGDLSPSCRHVLQRLA